MYKNITKHEDILSKLAVNKLGDLHTAYLTFANWPDFAFNRFGMRGSFEPRFRTEKARIDEKRNIVSFDWHGKKVRFFYENTAQLMDIFYTFAELFKKGDYSDLDVAGKTVIDIGANVGDTAIYFALRGARHIYAFEPFRFAYNTAKKNVRLNGISKKVTLLNMGCSGHDGKIRIDMNAATSLSSRLIASKRGKVVQVISLNTIADRYVKGDAILKMDCEGSEYDIILSASSKTLRKFSQMTIEYHFGYLDLKKKLESSGFTTSHTPPRMMFGDKNIRIGLIRAWQNKQ